VSDATGILLASLCLLANGFFVAAEFAIVKVRGTRIEELAEAGSSRARLVRHILSQRNAYLFACQVGISLASLGLGWLGRDAVATALQRPLAAVGIESDATIEAISFLLAFTLVVFFHIVVGEQAARSLAVRNADRWAINLAWPLRTFYWLAFPFIWVVDRASRGLLRLLGVQPATEGELALSEEELKLMVASSHEGGLLDEAARDLLDNVFEFRDQVVHEIMVPRTQMQVLHVDHPVEENLALVRETMHTRYPLVQGDRDHVVGMIHLKDLYFGFLESGGAPPDLATIKREIIAVPDMMTLSDLLALFRNRHVHMAIAVDEYGGTSGLVTLEDLIEELVGEIEDEFDEDEEPIKAEGEDTWLVDGDLGLRDLAKATGRRIDEEDVDSVGGLVMLHMHRIPKQGDRVCVHDLEFEIVRMQAYRVGRVKVTACRPPENGEAAASTAGQSER
jgi:CBS domain containing-hemolysin-like protein